MPICTAVKIVISDGDVAATEAQDKYQEAVERVRRVVTEPMCQTPIRDAAGIRTSVWPGYFSRMLDEGVLVESGSKKGHETYSLGSTDSPLSVLKRTTITHFLDPGPMKLQDRIYEDHQAAQLVKMEMAGPQPPLAPKPQCIDDSGESKPAEGTGTLTPRRDAGARKRPAEPRTSR